MGGTAREPVVAGLFYPEEVGALKATVARLLADEGEQHDLLACVAPHAGYVYSGGVAGHLFAHLRLPRRIVLLGPNHTGAGSPIAVAPQERWRTPLGDVAIDRELAEALAGDLPAAQLDTRAHWREHSLEVELPFLQARRSDLAILPICLQHLELDEALELGGVLAAVVERLGEPVGIVASSDMTHYRPEREARQLDAEAIDAALGLDPRRLYETVHQRGITMCGVVPATVALAAAGPLGAAGAHLVAYATSAETSGDTSAVVGYAGICIHR